MIQINEIMIGNIIQHKAPRELATVLAVSASGNVSYHDGHGTTDSHLSAFDPIKLTDSVLEAIGFRHPLSIYDGQPDVSTYELKGHDFPLWWDSWDKSNVGWYATCNNEYTVGVAIKYLHQLQNAFHFLTGDNIEIDTELLNAALC